MNDSLLCICQLFKCKFIIYWMSITIRSCYFFMLAMFRLYNIFLGQKFVIHIVEACAFVQLVKQPHAWTED